MPVVCPFCEKPIDIEHHHFLGQHPLTQNDVVVHFACVTPFLQTNQLYHCVDCFTLSKDASLFGYQNGAWYHQRCHPEKFCCVCDLFIAAEQQYFLEHHVTDGAREYTLHDDCVSKWELFSHICRSCYQQVAPKCVFYDHCKTRLAFCYDCDKDTSTGCCDSCE